jgi:hypothetical protein
MVQETLWGGEVPRPWRFRLRLVKPGGVDCGRCGWKEVGREGWREGRVGCVYAGLWGFRLRLVKPGGWTVAGVGGRR